MSDFDKEAERERLREKYEQDKADREVTERMSELLLKGATMTNAHCHDCGDPIFRYDGQEFCPTCEKPVNRGDAAADGSAEDAETADGDAPGDSGDSEQIEVATPDETARVRFGWAEADAQADPTDTAEDTSRQGPQTDSPSPDHPSDSEPVSPDQQPGAPSDVAMTHAELHGRIRQLSQRAGSCDDPRDAEAFLSAAREAAEALAALRR